MALVGVAEEAVQHVCGVDEEGSAEEGLDEVAWAAHLGHEFSEEQGTAIGVDALHKAVD